jgi:hypothetical protein
MSRLLAFWLDHGDPWVQEWRWTRAVLAATVGELVGRWA